MTVPDWLASPLPDGLELAEEEGRNLALWRGRTLVLPDDPAGPLGTALRAWASGRIASEPSRQLWFWDPGRVRSAAAASLAGLVSAEAARMGGSREAREAVFEVGVFACLAAVEGRSDLLQLSPEGARTPLQQWAAAFYAFCGPRRASLSRLGAVGRGRGGGLFDRRYMEEWWRSDVRPLPLSREFCQSLLDFLHAWSWVREGASWIGADLSVLGQAGEDLGLGRESLPGEDLGSPIPVEGGFGGSVVDWASQGESGFAALCRTRAEWTACRARSWALWPSSMASAPLDRLVLLAPPRDAWPHRESEIHERKAGFEWDPRLKRVNGDLRLSVIRTVAAFLNTEGGTVALGVRDDGEVTGMGAELSRFRSRDPLDVLEQKIREAVKRHLRPHPLGLVRVEHVDWTGKLVVLLRVEPASGPVEMVEKDGSTGELRASVYRRDGNRTVRT